MDGPTRPTPPSAIDGYRRLERTRKVVAGHVPVATAVVPARRRAVSSARVAGMLRLAGFIAVLAVIIGTSVGLASADSRADARRVAAKQVAPAAEPVAAETPSDKLATSAIAKEAPVAASTGDDASAADAPVVEESVAVAAADATPAAATGASTTTTSLPFTGEPSLDHILLFGAGLVLLGMLVQIAGQPLPANRAHARTR